MQPHFLRLAQFFAPIEAAFPDYDFGIVAALIQQPFAVAPLQVQIGKLEMCRVRKISFVD